MNRKVRIGSLQKSLDGALVMLNSDVTVAWRATETVSTNPKPFNVFINLFTNSCSKTIGKVTRQWGCPPKMRVSFDLSAIVELVFVKCIQFWNRHKLGASGLIRDRPVHESFRFGQRVRAGQGRAEQGRDQCITSRLGKSRLLSSPRETVHCSISRSPLCTYIILSFTNTQRLYSSRVQPGSLSLVIVLFIWGYLLL